MTPHGVGRCPKGRGDRSVRGGRRSRSEGSFCETFQYKWKPLSQCCALPALTERSLLSLRDISPFHGESPLSGEPMILHNLSRDTASRVRQFVSGEIPLKTFHPRKAVFPFCFRQTNRTRLAVSLQVCSSPAALSWSSLFGDSFSESFRFCTMLFVICFYDFVGTRRAVSAVLSLGEGGFAPAQNRNSPRTLSLSPDFLDTSPQIRYNRGNATAYPAVNQKWERNVAR